MHIELEISLRLLLAAALGAAIGYQRERAHKQAGLRTHILICLGAAVFTVASVYGFGAMSDPSRVAAGVVAGIGFIGAGAILHRDGGFVEGLTTAATIWAGRYRAGGWSRSVPGSNDSYCSYIDCTFSASSHPMSSCFDLFSKYV